MDGGGWGVTEPVHLLPPPCTFTRTTAWRTVGTGDGTLGTLDGEWQLDTAPLGRRAHRPDVLGDAH